MELKIQKQLAADDYIAAQFLHLSWRFYAKIGVVLLVISTGVAYALNPEDCSSFLELGVVIWLIWFSVFLVAHVWKVKRSARKTYAQQKSLQILHECRITDDMFYTHSDMGDARHKWVDFHKWKGNETLILVYLSDRLFLMFPRRAFASTVEFEDFKKLLTITIGPMGKAKKPSRNGLTQ